jgi:hypothetical protein
LFIGNFYLATDAVLSNAEAWTLMEHGFLKSKAPAFFDSAVGTTAATTLQLFNDSTL